MLIMYLLGMLFHPANVSSLVFALELKSCSALCGHVVSYVTFWPAILKIYWKKALGTFLFLNNYLLQCYPHLDIQKSSQGVL